MKDKDHYDSTRMNTNPHDEAVLGKWFGTEPWDRRGTYVPLKHENQRWAPLPGTDQQPVMLVSWYGA